MIHTKNIGLGADLTKGLRLVLNYSDPGQLPFFPAQQTPIAPAEAISRQTVSDWTVKITLHDSVEDLAAELQPLRIQNAYRDPAVSRLPLGQLTLGDADRESVIKSLFTFLGLDLPTPDEKPGFALICWERTDATVAYPNIANDGYIAKDHADAALTVNARSKLSALRPGFAAKNPFVLIDRRPTPDQAKRIVEAFHEFGTHFVSQITLGDRIVQVFSYKDNNWQQIRKEHGEKTIAGRTNVRSFKYYTQKLDPTGLGFVHQVGSPLILSGNQVFKDTLAKKLLHDPVYAQSNSILTLMDNKDLLKSFTSTNVPIAYSLVPISNLLVEPLLGPVTQNVTDLVRDLFMGIMLLKYDSREQLRFQRQFPNQLNSLLRFGFDDLQSNIATRQIDLFMPSLTLDQLVLVNPEDVETLNLFGIAIEVGTSGKTVLPGKDVALGCFYLSGTEDQAENCLKPGVIVLDDQAYDKPQYTFGWVDGAVAIHKNSGKARKVLVRGVVLTMAVDQLEEGRWTVEISNEKMEQLTATLFDRFESSLNLSVVMAETLLRVPARTDSKAMQNKIAQSHLDWLRKALIDDQNTSSAKMSDFAKRIAYISNTSETNQATLQVPPFVYQAYEPQVANIKKYADGLIGHLRNLQQQIASERSQAVLLQQQQQITKALQNQSKLLNGFIDSTATYHQEATAALRQLIEKDSQELTQQLATAKALKEEFLQKQLDAKTAMNNYTLKLLKDYQKKLVMSIFDGISAIFSVGKAIASEGEGAGEAFTKVIDFAKSVKDLVDFVQKLQEVAQKIAEASDKTKLLNDVQAFLRQERGELVGQPTSADWSNFIINIKDCLKEMPEGKDTILSAYEEMVNVGKAWFDTLVNAHQTSREIYANTLRREIEEAQDKRLRDLANTANASSNDDKALQPKTAKVDLMGISGILQLRIAQALASLAQALEKQDEALVYETFKEPYQLNNFSLDALNAAIAEQSAILTPDKLPSYETLEPIIITIPDVPVSEIIDGKFFEHEILIEKTYGRLSNHLYHVRVDYYEVEIEGLAVKPGESGDGDIHYSVEVKYLGTPFYDRDPHGQAKKFRIPDMVRAIEVNPNTHENSKPEYLKPNYNNPQPTRVTPYSRWRVRLLDTSAELQSKNLGFTSNNVQLKYTFHVSAGDTRAVTHGRIARFAAFAQLTTDYSLSSFLANLHTKETSALMGWDAVFSLAEKKVNDLLAQQWSEKHESLPLMPEIKMSWEDDFGEKFSLTLTGLKLGAPKLQFSDNVANFATLNMELKGGAYEEKKEGASKTVQGNIESGNLTGSVKLELVEGDVTPDGTQTGKQVSNITLDFAKGAFNTIQIADLKLTPTAIATIGNTLQTAIVDYFKAHNFAYRIGALDFTGHSGLIDALTPHNFYLRTINMDANHRYLQLFINTQAKAADGNAPSYRNGQGDLHLSTTVPVPDGYDCCLMINSMILFRDILSAGFNPYTLEAKNIQSDKPDKSEVLWSAKIPQWFQITEDFDIGNKHLRAGTQEAGKGRTTVTPANLSFTRKEDTPPFGLTSFTKIATDMPRQEWRIGFDLFYEAACYPVGGGAVSCVPAGWDNNYDYVNAGLALNFNATLNITGGNAGDQLIGLSMKDVDLSSITISADARMPSRCPSPSDYLRQEIKTKVEAQLPGKIQSEINRVVFNSISVFALQNLLFPGKNVIEFKSVHAPGDLVILGEIKVPTK